MAPTLLFFWCAQVGAASPPPGWKQESLPGLCRCWVPENWRRYQSFSDPLGATVFTDGLLMIKVARGLAQGLGPKTPQEFRSVYEVGSQFTPAGTLMVGGRPAERWSRKRPGRQKKGPEEWIYEEMVFLTDREGFWALWFTSSSPVHRAQPQGLDTWQRFLECFEPGPPGAEPGKNQ